MHVLLVSIQVLPESVDAFIAATRANARSSLKETGVLRFDFCQQTDDPARFIIFEVYRDASDHAAHRETAHYLTWRDAVAPMMAGPRQGARYQAIDPDEPVA